MSSFNPFLWATPHGVRKYAIAVLSVTTALILCAVMFSAWFGGIVPALLSTALSDLAFYYYFLSPMHSLGAKPHEIPRLLAFTFSNVIVALLTVAQRSATELLRRARDDLKETVQQLQTTNEALRAESIERKHAEDKLRRSETYLAEAQKLSHTGSWAWKVDTQEIIHSSREHSRLFGFDSEEGPWSLERLRRRVHPEDQDELFETWVRAVHEGKDYETDFRIVLSGGVVRYIHAVGHPFFNESGNVVEFIGTSMDVTERRRAEEERERFRQAQADLAHVSRVTTMGELSASLA